MRAPSATASRRLVAAAIPLGLLLSGILVWHASHAAFTATTASPDSTWETGTVELSDDGAGSAMFTSSGLGPGVIEQRCIRVTYDGDLDAEIRLYAEDVLGGLDQYLDLEVERGTGTAGFGDCDGFTPETTIFDGTLAGFAALDGYGDGVGAWVASSAGEDRVYRFTTSVQGDNAAQGTSASATFVWEARST